MQSWQEYYQLSQHSAPSALLERALPYIQIRNKALDLGAGSLRDSKFLLSVGFRQVTALDQEKEIKKFATKIPRSMLKFRITSFQNLKRLPKNYFDLVNASFSLPFAYFELLRIIKLIKTSLKPGGIFCGQFFGLQDSWNTPENQTFLIFTNKKTVQQFFENFQIIYFKEGKFQGKTIDNQPKYWHLFDVIAQKKSIHHQY